MAEKTDPREELIREKVQAGLSRADAIAVIKAQEEHDAALAAAEKKSAKKKDSEEK